MNESQEKSGGLVSGYAMPKGWQEITSDEKIERLREIVKQLQSTISYQNNQLQNVTKSFEQHFHNGEKIVVPFDRYASNSYGLVGDTLSPKSSIKAYF